MMHNDIIVYKRKFQ